MRFLECLCLAYTWEYFEGLGSLFRRIWSVWDLICWWEERVKNRSKIGSVTYVGTGFRDVMYVGTMIGVRDWCPWRTQVRRNNESWRHIGYLRQRFQNYTGFLTLPLSSLLLKSTSTYPSTSTRLQEQISTRFSVTTSNHPYYPTEAVFSAINKHQAFGRLSWRKHRYTFSFFSLFTTCGTKVCRELPMVIAGAD